MDNKEFGLWFANLREKSGFKSQRQLYLVSDVSTSTLSRIEAGIQKPEPETLKKLAPHLKISYEELMQAAGYLKDAPEQLISNAVMDDPDLKDFWNELKDREELQLLFKQTKDLSPDAIKKVIRVIKAIEDEEAQED